MSEYKTVKLGDICEIKAGGTPSRSNKKYWTNGNIPWVKIGDMKNKYLSNTDEYITGSGLENSSAKLFKKGAILYTIFATLGEVSILDIEATTNQAIAGIEIKDKSINKEYLYYHLKSLKSYINSIGRGVAQNNINLSLLRNLVLNVPKPRMQEVIANNLDKIQSLIQKRKKQLFKLDELAKSQFIEMFGDPISNPKGWKIEKLGNVALLKAGKNVKSSQLTYKNKINKYPCFGGNGVRGYFNKFSHDGNFPLIGRQGALCGNLQFATSKFWATEHAIVVSSVKNYNPFWLFFLLDLLNLNRFAGGAAQPGLNVCDLNKLKIILPNIEMQNNYHFYIQQLDKSKFRIEKSLKHLEIARTYENI